jgi:hypothetical protein
MFTPEFGNAIDNITLRDIVTLEKFFFRPDRRKAPAPHSGKGRPTEGAFTHAPHPRSRDRAAKK